MSADPMLNRFDPPIYGPDTEPEDEVRYSEQHARLLDLLRKGFRGSAEEFRIAAYFPIGTRTDSRLRDLRKVRFGAHVIRREYNPVTKHHEYWMPELQSKVIE